MAATSFLKGIAVLLVALSGQREGVLICLCLLVGLVDAAQSVIPEEHPRRTYWLTQLTGLLKQFFSLRVWPFYALLLAVVLLTGGQRPASGQTTPVKGGLGANRGWGDGASAVSHGQGSTSGLCACGKPLGHEKSGSANNAKSATPPPSAAEISTRLEKLKQRGMTPPVNVNQLPGLGPNSKPLPPGLKPNPDAKLPEGVNPK
jgi:hypothetical protein